MEEDVGRPTRLEIGSLIGRTPDEAREIAEAHGYAVQVVPQDAGVTLDIVPGRVRLITDGNSVTEALYG